MLVGYAFEHKFTRFAKYQTKTTKKLLKPTFHTKFYLYFFLQT